jgi:hypothetical protein
MAKSHVEPPEVMFHPSACCEGLSEVFDHGGGHGFDPKWDFVRCLRCGRTYIEDAS